MHPGYNDCFTISLTLKDIERLKNLHVVNRVKAQVARGRQLDHQPRWISTVSIADVAHAMH